MESLKRSLKYQWMESKTFILKFWMTVILINILFYILNVLPTMNNSIGLTIGFSLGSTETSSPMSLVGVNFLIIFVVLIVYNYERNYGSFPLSQSLSMTRKNYFISFLIDNLLISFIFAGIQGLLLKVDPYIVKSAGGEPLYDFINFNLKTDNILFIIFTLFILFLACISFFNLLASLNYKFGYKLWIVLVGANIILSILNIRILGEFTNGISKFIERFLVGRLGLVEVFLILGTVALFYIFNYFITVNTDIKKKTI